MKKAKLFCVALATFFLAGMVNAEAAEVSVSTEADLYNCLVKDSNTCKLNGSIDLVNYLPVVNVSTIDLNGYNITYKGGQIGYGVIYIWPDGNLTVKGNGTIDSGDNGKLAIQVTENSELTINGGNIVGNDFAVSGNGLQHNTKITINGGSLTSDNTGIYHPQYGDLTINGGTITGASTGIELRSGNLIVNGGTIVGNGVPTSSGPNGNGTTTEGAGIAIAQHTTEKPISVTINNGNVKGYSAIYQSNPQSNETDNISLAIKGGNFDAINGGTVSVYSEDLTEFITGGIFSTDVSKYIASGYGETTLANGDKVVGKPKPAVTSGTNGTAASANESTLDDVPKTGNELPILLVLMTMIAIVSGAYSLKTAKCLK